MPESGAAGDDDAAAAAGAASSSSPVNNAFRLVSAEEKGAIIVWTVLDSRHDPDQHLGMAHWGAVRWGEGRNDIFFLKIDVFIWRIEEPDSS